MRLSVMAGLNAKLSEVTRGWQQMQSQWQEEDREEVARQLHTVTGQHFEADEVDELVQTGGTEQIYRSAMASANSANVRECSCTPHTSAHPPAHSVTAGCFSTVQVLVDTFEDSEDTLRA